MGPSGEIVKTRGTVHFISGNTIYYFHVVDDKYLPATDGILGREVINSLSDPSAEPGPYIHETCVTTDVFNFSVSTSITSDKSYNFGYMACEVEVNNPRQDYEHENLYLSL